jgi:putative membrane protein
LSVQHAGAQCALIQSPLVENEVKESRMRAQRIILHAAAVTALCACCMAQGSMGSQGMGQPNSGQRNPQGIGQNGVDSNAPPSMSSETDAASTNMKSPDQAFMMKAAQGGIAEVNLGNLAKQNGGSDAVKQFGDKMVTDHTQANDQLHQLAQQKGITLPSSPSSKDKRLSKMLESKQGADFDKAYIHDMVRDHEEDIAEFRREAQNGRDPDVKAWAQKTLPTLEQHLDNAKQVAGQVGATKSSGAMSAPQ